MKETELERLKKACGGLTADALTVVLEVEEIARAEECDCCKALLEGIADILHNQETQRSPIAAYGLTEDCQMRAAAKVLRHIATALIVRRKNILEGKV